jgi:hypothetical protein
MTRRKDPRTARSLVPAGELPAFTPVPRQYQRHDGWTPERQRGFIEALADTGSVEAACKAVDMSQPGAYHLRRQPGAASFRKAWEAALQLGVQRVEDVVMDRALNGVEEPLYSYGKLIGTRRRYNDRLLMFILRNRAPDRFAEGKPKGMNAVDTMELERLKKKWRKEWEAESAQARNVTAAEVRASIDRKIEEIRLRVEAERAARHAALSPETHAAFAHFISLRDRDLAAIDADERTRRMVEVRMGVAGTHFDPPALPAPKRAAEEEPPQHPPEGYSYRKPKPPRPPKTTWTLMDESFDP